MDVLKLTTAGSVDNGKSTLIGRLLYDTNSLSSDVLESIEETSKKSGLDYLDLSLATDGLTAEREQGITIDVAHIYFSTNSRSYIIADSPGHEEYTRNMVTGASTSDAAIILVDARNGVTEQTKRHFYIHNLLRTKEVIVAINKMDLTENSQDIFLDIVSELESLHTNSEFKNQNIQYVPISALRGDNVAEKSQKFPWYSGPSLLGIIEQIDHSKTKHEGLATFPVQTVIRPKTEDTHDFRGYAGKLYGNTLKVGDKVTILPSGTHSEIKSIRFFDKSYTEVNAGSSFTLILTTDVDVSRGSTIVKTGEEPNATQNLVAKVCWMNGKALKAGSKFILQHGTNRILVRTKNIVDLLAKNFSSSESGPENLGLNDIGTVEFQTSEPIYADAYSKNPSNGAFILIDPQTKNTVAVGFVQND